MIEAKETWIKTGYEMFALSGETSLKIEKLARRVGVSKSSFYHYFADLEVFVEQLLQYHLQQSLVIADKEKNVKSIMPELANIILEHKTDILFSRQLRFNQQVERYRLTLLQSNRIIGKEFIQIWVADLKIKLNPVQAEGLFGLALDNFYLQVNPENLTLPWLNDYFANLKRIAASFA